MTAPDSRPEAVSRPRRIRSRLLRAAVGGSVIAVGAAALSGVLPGVPLRGGPLEGLDGLYASLPVQPADTGVLWGVLNLRNRSGSTIVLDSVEVAENPGRLPLLKQPYLWDEDRTRILGFNGTDGYPLPLPADWHLPPERPVPGFSLPSGTPEQIGNPDEETGYAGPTAEVLFEFAAPTKPIKLSGITVRYHIGPLAYRRTFDTSIVLCPADDLGPCQAVTG